jgi:hypothetical protein
LTASHAPTVQELVDAWTSVPVNPYYAAAFDYKSPVDFLHSLATKYDIAAADDGGRLSECRSAPPSRRGHGRAMARLT